ncbi:MAG: quinolinate synthase NadA, partial [Chloroflexi bacterium]|nr:quinolinate synthase NadA [Chloroflexota bacterium]
VNIMTKLDRDRYRDGQKLPPEFADAMSALRGFANSTVRGGIVLSAGMNRRLYNYLSQFDDLLPDENGVLKKTIILKVSDFRSAMIQGRFLAKRGLWISEYRIESGLNCGGHAFATKGYLLGPILEEFKANRKSFVADLHKTYAKALAKAGREPAEPGDIIITAQCGLSTAAEDKLMMEYYCTDGTGWGTPFLLVPEAVSIEQDTLDKLAAAKDEDILLTEGSPLGVPIWLLDTCEAEDVRRRRNDEGKPGAECPKGFLKDNTEFTDKPLCTASRTYAKRKVEHLPSEGFSPSQLAARMNTVLSRACVCHELSGGVTRIYDIHPSVVALVCPGPNIADFSRTMSLDEMVVWNPFKRLGGNTPEQLRNAKLILWQGHCAVHTRFSVKQIQAARDRYPDVTVLVHPECTMETVQAADLNGSTEFIRKQINEAPAGSKWAVGTEISLVNRLAINNPDKVVFCLDPVSCPCSTMYRIHPAYLLWVLEGLIEGQVINQITVPEETKHYAQIALNQMLALR